MPQRYIWEPPGLRPTTGIGIDRYPLTHAHFLRHHRGTYGPAIAASQGTFPGPGTPIGGLYRVGDSTLPRIGIPAVATSGILCANSLVEPGEMEAVLELGNRG